MTDIYTVRSGESLSIIARDVLGDVNKWKELAFLNGLSHPYFIYPGQILELPKEGQTDIFEVINPGRGRAGCNKIRLFIQSRDGDPDSSRRGPFVLEEIVMTKKKAKKKTEKKVENESTTETKTEKKQETTPVRISPRRLNAMK